MKWMSKVSGILLIIIGFGIPLCSLVITIICGSPPLIYEQTAVLTIPLIVIALWIFPVRGGFNAFRSKKWSLALVGSIVGFCYMLILSPFLGMASEWTRWQNPRVSALTIFFYLLCTIPLLSIPAMILVVVSKKDFD